MRSASNARSNTEKREMERIPLFLGKTSSTAFLLDKSLLDVSYLTRIFHSDMLLFKK
jgi:hypothetical protein